MNIETKKFSVTANEKTKFSADANLVEDKFNVINLKLAGVHILMFSSIFSSFIIKRWRKRYCMMFTTRVDCI